MKSLIFTAFLIMMLTPANNCDARSVPGSENRDTLLVVWTSGDIEVAEKMVFMYTLNAAKQKWFDHVIFVVWGPSAKLLADTPKLQAEIKKMKDAGITVEACIACASMYGVVDTLKGIGIDVKGMGVPLSTYLKKGYSSISF